MKAKTQRWIETVRQGLVSGAFVLMGGVFIACSILPGGGKGLTPVQMWLEDRGPVVPHDDFPSDCSICHEGTSWHQIKADFEFDHELETGTALVGAHAEAECLRCHNDRGPVQLFAEKGCAGCHEDVHTGQLGTDCTLCHDETSWRPSEAIRAHNQTRFPLVGTHAAVACWRCHPGADVGNFSPTTVECASCHQADLARALNPDHVSAGFTTDCDRCHIPTTWGGSGFTHASYPLTGAHVTASCQQCHVNLVFTGTPTDCYSCHTSDYTSAPDHVSGGYPTNCDMCHNTTTWEGAPFSHAGITSGCADCHLDDYQGTTDPNHQVEGFPTTCEQCHSTNAWRPVMFNHAGITSGCADCHLPDYQGTTDPNHQATGIPTTCEQCHSTNAWTPASFNHAGITSGCVDCHLDDYQGTTDPNHQAAGFPTSCEQCHSGFNSWSGGSFNHNQFFPLTGPHGGRSCSDCHLVPNNFSSFSCTHCHAHRQSAMNSEHSGVNGYSWSSPACLNCHPDGRD